LAELSQQLNGHFSLQKFIKMNLQCNLPIAMQRGWQGLIVFVPHGDAKDPT